MINIKKTYPNILKMIISNQIILNIIIMMMMINNNNNRSIKKLKMMIKNKMIIIKIRIKTINNWKALLKKIKIMIINKWILNKIRFKTINNWKIYLKKLKMMIIKQKRTLKILKISTRIIKKNTFKKNQSRQKIWFRKKNKLLMISKKKLMIKTWK